MATAKYLNTGPEPGAWVARLGRFVAPGKTFEIDAPDYVPSRFFVALNREAAAALARLRADLVAQGKSELAARVRVDAYASAEAGPGEVCLIDDMPGGPPVRALSREHLDRSRLLSKQEELDKAGNR